MEHLKDIGHELHARRDGGGQSGGPGDLVVRVDVLLAHRLEQHHVLQGHDAGDGLELGACFDRRRCHRALPSGRYLATPVIRPRARTRPRSSSETTSMTTNWWPPFSNLSATLPLTFTREPTMGTLRISSRWPAWTDSLMSNWDSASQMPSLARMLAGASLPP